MLVRSRHPHPPHPSPRFVVCAVAFVLALAGLGGCNHEGQGQGARAHSSRGYPALVPPTQPIFLVQPGERALGPLKVVPESEVQLVKKQLPFGTLSAEVAVFDTDAAMRVTGPHKVVDVRAVEHRGTVRRMQGLGATGDGFVRYRLEYARDSSAWLERGQRIAKPSPVEGKSYLLDVGPSGLRVLTDKGNTPSAEEVAIIQEDYSDLAHRAKADPEAGKLRPGAPGGLGGLAPPPKASDFVVAHIRKSLGHGGLVLDQVAASFSGVRDVAGVPCAMFNVSLIARKQTMEPTKTVSTEMRLGGEYAMRLDDGWEAELLLSGTRMSVTQMVKDGVPLTIHSAAFTRAHVRTSYTAPDPETQRKIEILRRAPGGPS